MVQAEIDWTNPGAETVINTNPGRFIEHHVRAFGDLIPPLSSLLEQPPLSSTHAQYKQKLDEVERIVEVHLIPGGVNAMVNVVAHGKRAEVSGNLTLDGWSLAQASFFEKSGSPVSSQRGVLALYEAEKEFIPSDQ